MRYFGFDLGDGESCVALYTSQQVEPVVIPVHGRGSFLTAVADFDNKTVIGSLAGDNPQAENLRVCFKRTFRAGNGDADRAITAFAAGVLTALRDHTTIRDVLDSGDASFVVGCPADWSREVRDRYRTLLTSAGLPNVHLVSESRAAFLSAAMTDDQDELRRLLMDCALVIDLGSSTLDLAYVCDGQEYAVSTMGTQVGGGILDELLLEHAISQHCAEEADVIRKVLDSEPAWKNRLMLSARRLKERFFTLNNGEALTKQETIFREGRHVLDITISDAVIEELSERPSSLLNGESFRSRLMNCLMMAQQVTSNRPPKIVLLTGGASRMAFFRQLCRDTFPNAQFQYSTSPEYDIARGLSCAGHIDEMLKRLKEDVASYVESDAVENHVAQAMPKLTEALSGVMTDALLEQVILPEFRAWQQGKTDTFADMEAKCQPRAEELLKTDKWREQLATVVTPWLDGILTEVQHDLNDLCVKYGVDIQRLQIRSATIPTGSLSMQGVLTMPGMTDMPLVSVLFNIIMGVITAALCGGGGVALLVSGPLGLVIGFIIGLIIAFFGESVVDTLLRPMLKHWKMPKLLRKQVKEEHLRSGKSRQRIASILEETLTNEDAMQKELGDRIGKCIDQAILQMTEEKGMAVV